MARSDKALKKAMEMRRPQQAREDVAWLFEQLTKQDRPMPNENEVTIQREGRVVKMALLDGEAKITGDIDFDKLCAIIDANLLALQRDQKD